MNPVWTIARFAWLEARRGRLVVLLLLWLAGCSGAAVFLAQLALTESHDTYLAVAAALLRGGAACLITLMVVPALVREQQDRTLDWLLAMPLARGHYYAGKWLGYAAVALLMAILAVVPLAASAPPMALAAWSAALFGELLIVASFALFVALSVSQVPMALFLCGGFYLLARSAGAMVLMADHPVLPSGDWGEQLFSWVAHGLAGLLPALDRFGDAGWLLEAGRPALGNVLIDVLVYGALLVAASLFDLYRKEL